MVLHTQLEYSTNTRHQRLMSSKEPILSPQAAELKAQANDLFKSGDFDQAFDVFTAAISEENHSPALYSNRSATAMKMKNFDQALKDAEKAVKARGTFEALPINYLLIALFGTA
jgi:tetratricopeptide (TPR) repeat protein